MTLKTPLYLRVFFLLFFGIMSYQRLATYSHDRPDYLVFGLVAAIAALLHVTYERRITIDRDKITIFSSFTHRVVKRIMLCDIDAILRLSAQDGSSRRKLLLKNGFVVYFEAPVRFLEVFDKQNRDLRQILIEDYGISERKAHAGQKTG